MCTIHSSPIASNLPVTAVWKFEPSTVLPWQGSLPTSDNHKYLSTSSSLTVATTAMRRVHLRPPRFRSSPPLNPSLSLLDPTTESSVLSKNAPSANPIASSKTPGAHCFSLHFPSSRGPASLMAVRLSGYVLPVSRILLCNLLLCNSAAEKTK